MTKNKQDDILTINNTTNNSEEDKQDVEIMADNFLKATEIYQDMVNSLWKKKNAGSIDNSMVDPYHIQGLFGDAISKIFSDPEKLIGKQMEFANDYLDICNNISSRFVGQKNIEPLFKPARKDRRFSDESWENTPYYDYIKQSYIMTSGWLQDVFSNIEGIDSKESHKVSFYTKQILDMLSPSNYLATNPEAIKEALETKGQSILKGLENLKKDIEHSDNGFNVSTTDATAFKVGENLAATKGSVVFENKLFQLIRYEPANKKTFAKPVLVIPAWINKFYILDLKENNSYVSYLLNQGYSVFMVSWVNPDESYADVKFEQYITEGVITAMEQVLDITGSKQCSAVGYCLGGTALAISLSYLKKKKKNYVSHATFLTTLLDFDNAGDMCVFIDKAQVESTTRKMEERGYLSANEMSQSFSMLRANDMIWSFVVHNYLLGKDLFPFDLLYWNSDSTNIPAATHSFYLKNMYLENNLVKKNGIEIDGIKIDLTNIDIPAYFLSAKDDHIAPWHCTFKANKILKDNTRFVLSESGHIAGVVNNLTKNKYCHWTNDDVTVSADKWFENATRHEESWRSDWLKWHSKLSGEKIELANNSKEIEPAPGRYVKIIAK